MKERQAKPPRECSAAVEKAEPLMIRELSEAEKDENTADDHCDICNEYESECTCGGD